MRDINFVEEFKKYKLYLYLLEKIGYFYYEI